MAGEVPPGIVEGERCAVPISLVHHDGSLPVRDLIDFGARKLPGEGPLVIVTNRDLTMRESQWLFGFADQERGVAVVSTFRLNDPDRPHLLKQRVENEIAHELGHLRGVGHCRNADCVMTAVTQAHQLDGRPATICGNCPGSRWTRFPRMAAASLFLLMILAALDYLGPLVAGEPFEESYTLLNMRSSGILSTTAADPSDRAHVYFNKNDWFVLDQIGNGQNGNVTIRARSVPLVKRVGDIWQPRNVPGLTVYKAGPDYARVQSGDTAIVDVMQNDGSNADVLAEAHRLRDLMLEALGSKPGQIR